MNSRFARFLILVVAAIQFAVPAAASIAEGVFALRTIDPRAHVEEKGQKDCVPPHGADCVVCRYLVDNVGHPEVPVVVPNLEAVRTTAVAEESRGATSDRLGFEARGPPAMAG